MFEVKFRDIGDATTAGWSRASRASLRALSLASFSVSMEICSCSGGTVVEGRKTLLIKFLIIRPTFLIGEIDFLLAAKIAIIAGVDWFSRSSKKFQRTRVDALTGGR